MAADSSFCYPVRTLETDHLRVEPLYNNPETANLIYGLLSSRPEVYRYLPTAPFEDVPSVQSRLLVPFAGSPTAQLYLLVVKNTHTYTLGTETRTGQPAGMIAYLHSDATHLMTEIGWVVIFPEWQRTFVNTHAVGLLLRYALDSKEQGGLGLRRVEWRCHSLNGPSRRAAERMGFVFEGVLRWAIVLPFGKEGNGRDDVKEGAKPGRDTAMLSMTWEDWKRDGKREFVEGLMGREVEGGVLEGRGRE